MLADHPIRPTVMKITPRRLSASEPRHGVLGVALAVVGSLACAVVLQLMLGAG